MCVCVCVCSAAKSLANRSGGVEREEKVTQHRYTLIRHSHLVYFRSWTAIQWSDCFNCFSCKCLFGLEQKGVFCVLSERLFVCVCLLCDGERWGCLVTTSSSWQWGEALGCQLFFFIQDCLSHTHTHTHTLIKITAAHLSKRWGNSHIRCDVHAAIFNTHTHTQIHVNAAPWKNLLISFCFYRLLLFMGFQREYYISLAHSH